MNLHQWTRLAKKLIKAKKKWDKRNFFPSPFFASCFISFFCFLSFFSFFPQILLHYMDGRGKTIDYRLCSFSFIGMQNTFEFLFHLLVAVVLKDYKTLFYCWFRDFAFHKERKPRFLFVWNLVYHHDNYGGDARSKFYV